jgi:hypothetical protein
VTDERVLAELTEFDDDRDNSPYDAKPADDLSKAELEALKPVAEDPATPGPEEVN